MRRATRGEAQGHVESAGGRRRPDLWEISVVLLTLAAIAFLFADTRADVDLWGHVRFGGDTLAADGVVRTDLYSYLSTPGAWVNHEWLAEVAMWLAFHVLGVAGLVFLKVSLILLTALLLLAYLYRQRGVALTSAALLLMLAVPSLAVQLVPVRPQIFTVLFFAITVAVLGMAESGRPRLLWGLAPVFAIWVNCHGGVLAGVGIVGVWTTARLGVALLQTSQPPAQRLSRIVSLLLPFAAILAATLVTPYGVGLMRFLVQTATVARPEIGEWQALALASPEGGAYLLVLSLTVVGLAYSRRPRFPGQMAIYACASLLPLVALRHVPLFALVALLTAGEHVYDVWGRRAGTAGLSRSSLTAPRLRLALTGASLIIAGALTGLSVMRMSVIHLHRDYQVYPARAVALLRDAVPRANLAIFFDWGEYAIWHLGPAIQVSLDGRRETVYGADIYEQNLAFMAGVGDWDSLLDDHPTDLALVSRTTAAYNLMLLKPGWVKVYEDPLCALFAAEDSPLADRLLTATPSNVPYDGDGLTFP